LVFEKRAVGARNKVVVGQVAQAWRTARNRAAADMAQAGASAASVAASVDNGAVKASGNSNLDLNLPQSQESDVGNSDQTTVVELEVPLEQLSPLERLREAKRRARVDGASQDQGPPT